MAASLAALTKRAEPTCGSRHPASACPTQTVAHSAISINSRQAEPTVAVFSWRVWQPGHRRLSSSWWAKSSMALMLRHGRRGCSLPEVDRSAALEGQWSSGSRRSMNSVLAITDSNSAS
jgi:hypothetical protein